MNRLLLIICMLLTAAGLTACPQTQSEDSGSGSATTSSNTSPKSETKTEDKPAVTDSASSGTVGTKIGNAFPNLDIVSETGTTLNIEALKGKVVLVNCFAHYCGPCKEEMPMLVKHFQANKDKNYALVLLPFDSTKTQIAQFYQKYGGEAYRRDESVDEADATKMAIFSYPYSFLLDKEGVIRKLWMGVIKESDLDAEIAKLHQLTKFSYALEFR